MKKLFVFCVAALLCSSLFHSCSDREFDSQPDVFPDDDLLTITWEIPTTRNFGLNTDGNITLSGDKNAAFTATFDLEADRVVKMEFSEELLELTGMSESQLHDYLKEEMGIFYYQIDVDDETWPIYTSRKGPFSELFDCIQNCKSTKPKGQGRGWCKAACWGDFGLTILTFGIL